MPIWHWHDLEDIKKNNSFILDVRTPEEFEIGTIEDAHNIDDLELRSRLDEIPKDKSIYVFCEVGFRGYLATRLLMQNGYKKVYNLTGGHKTFEMARMTTEEIAAACGPSEEILEELMESKTTESTEFIEVDACGLSCPGPLNALIKGLESLPENMKLKIYATDPGFKSSVEAYSKLNDSVRLLSLGKESGKLVAVLEKGKIHAEEMKAPLEIKKKARKDRRGPNAPALSQIDVEELYERLDMDDAPAILVDVRTPQEFHGRAGHVPSSKLIPLGDLMNNMDDLNEYKDDEIVVICHSGSRSMMASQLMVRAGFKDVRNLTGGMIAWHRKGFPVQPAIAEYE